MEKLEVWIGVISIALLLTVAGCTLPYNEYSGPPRPEHEIAVITPDSSVKIHALDGKVVNVKPEKSGDWYKWYQYTRIQLRPGEYTLSLIPTGIGTIKTFTRLTVRVEAGKRYRVRGQFYPGTSKARGYYKFWVDNEKTGVVVSDIVESRNPFQPAK